MFTLRIFTYNSGRDRRSNPTRAYESATQRTHSQPSTACLCLEWNECKVWWKLYWSKKKKLVIVACIPLAVDTTGRMYDEFISLLFLHAHREASALAGEFPEESDQFRFLHASCFTNLKGVVGLILAKTSDMWISIPLDLSSRS